MKMRIIDHRNQVDLHPHLDAFSKKSAAASPAKCLGVFVLAALIADLPLAATPTYSWSNNSPPGQSGSGYSSFGSAFSAAAASSIAGDPTPSDSCTVGATSGSFLNWSVLVKSYADLWISAQRPQGITAELDQDSVLPSDSLDPQKSLIPDSRGAFDIPEPLGNVCKTRPNLA